MKIGTLEAGGTKFVLGILNEDAKILSRLEIKTQKPEITLKKCVDFFIENKIDALGIGFFGPIDLDVDSKTYGYMLNTPKLNWSNTDVLGYFKKHLDVNICIDTDVNAACMAEYTMGKYKNTSDMIYITVGTGIGGGIITNHKLVHGAMHSELGHMGVLRHEKDLEFESVCPYHTNCAEGLCAGPSLFKRYNILGQDLKKGHECFELISFYMSQLIGNLIMTTCPKKIILGGGVMKNEFLVEMIYNDLVKYVNQYLPSKIVNPNLIVNTTLKNNAGLLGAYQLGLKALNEIN